MTFHNLSFEVLDMNPSIEVTAAPGKREREGYEAFYRLAHSLSEKSEADRIEAMAAGFKTQWLFAVQRAFDVNKIGLARLLEVSPSTIDRTVKGGRPLGVVASERLDRLAEVSVLAESVFEDKGVATRWMATPNSALGGSTPFQRCLTELGARQVRRILHAIEWGGVA